MARRCELHGRRLSRRRNKREEDLPRRFSAFAKFSPKGHEPISRFPGFRFTANKQYGTPRIMVKVRRNLVKSSATTIVTKPDEGRERCRVCEGAVRGGRSNYKMRKNCKGKVSEAKIETEKGKGEKSGDLKIGKSGSNLPTNKKNPKKGADRTEASCTIVQERNCSVPGKKNQKWAMPCDGQEKRKTIYYQKNRLKLN